MKRYHKFMLFGWLFVFPMNCHLVRVRFSVENLIWFEVSLLFTIYSAVRVALDQ